MSENILKFTDDDFEQEVLQADKVTMVDFWAEWCQPCHMLAPTVLSNLIIVSLWTPVILSELRIELPSTNAEITANFFSIFKIFTTAPFTGSQKEQIIFLDIRLLFGASVIPLAGVSVPAWQIIFNFKTLWTIQI